MVWFVVAVIVVGGALLGIVYQNQRMLRAVEAMPYDEATRAEYPFEVHRELDVPEAEWRPGVHREGIRVDWTHPPSSRPVVYRTTSWWRQEDVPVARIVALLDGGFLTEELWFKKDYQGGACLETLVQTPARSDWIASYLSRVPGMRLREFVYLVSRRAVPPAAYSRHGHPDVPIVEQVILSYRSVPAQRPGRVRATQFPSLDRLTRYADGTIRWEHIMRFHINGFMPLALLNLLRSSAMNVLWHEAHNLSKLSGRPPVSPM